MLAPAAGLRKERRTNGHFPSSGGAGWGGVERSGFSLRLTVVKCTTYEFSTNNHHIL
jgi:hypothetical protein